MDACSCNRKTNRIRRWWPPEEPFERPSLPCSRDLQYQHLLTVSRPMPGGTGLCFQTLKQTADVQWLAFTRIYSLSCPSTCLALQVQLVVLVKLPGLGKHFRDVSYSLVCLLFAGYLLRVPPCRAIFKSASPRALWSRGHWQHSVAIIKLACPMHSEEFIWDDVVAAFWQLPVVIIPQRNILTHI